MDRQEFSAGFDTLVDSYRRFKNFDDRQLLDSVEFNEYEKSVFLTKAQEELVLSLYNGKNIYGESFEQTEEQRRYLSQLVLDVLLEPISNTYGSPLGLDSKSKFFTLPDDLWFITYEAAKVNRDDDCDNMKTLDVIPVTQDKYHRTKRNPFRGANGKRALRLDLSDGVIEIVSKYDVTGYYLRYLKKPTPIILDDLPDGLSIEGISTALGCNLHRALHQRILEDAVRLALNSKGISAREEQRNNNNQ